MLKLLRYLFPLLSVYAAIVCTIWMCPSLPRLLSNEELQFDYIGAIVGILSLLVTALLTWNIYTVIDTKNIKKKYKSLERDVSFALSTTRIDLFATAVTLNKDAIKRVLDKESQRFDELGFHMILNYLQLILYEIQVKSINDAITHRNKMFGDMQNKKLLLTAEQMNLIHRLCGLISSECHNKHIGDIGVTEIFNHIEILQNNNHADEVHR